MPEEEIHEKWRGDPLGGVFFGLLLIFIACVYLFREKLPEGPWWAWLIAVVGFTFLLEAVIRSAIAKYRRPVLGRVIWGAVLLAVGSAFIYGFEDFWPVILIVAGIILLIYYIRQSI